MIEVLSLFLICMFYPNTEVAMTAQTQQNAAKMLRDKYTEIVRFWPILADEIKGKPQFGKDTAEIRFANGSIFNVLANNQNSKGQRRKRINIEESALLDAFTFDDALKPIVDFPRYTVGKYAIANPEEISSRINFFTTSGFRGSDEFNRSVQMVKGMADLTGEYVTGADFRLATYYMRGTTLEQMAMRREQSSSISFMQNYMSKWVGASENQLVDANKLASCRNLAKPELERTDEQDEYVFGIDVARSQKDDNNRSSVSILKIIRKENNSVKELRLVNLIIIPNAFTFTAQAIEIKRLYQQYKPKMCIVDVNGLGVGLKDELLKGQVDPLTGNLFDAWDTINTDDESEIRGAEQVVYCLYPQQAQSKVIVTFMDVVNSGKLRLLEGRDETSINLSSKDDVLAYAPYKQVDELIGEIVNLKIKQNNNGTLSIERVISNIDKDRFTSLAYGVWWIMEFDNTADNEDTTMSKFFQSVNRKLTSVGGTPNLVKKIFR